MRLKKIFSIAVLIVTNLFTQGQFTSNKSTTTSKPTILFVCEHGAGRSAIAAAFFNKMAKEKKLNYQAIFRGIHPDSALGPAIQTGLMKDSVDVNGWKPVLLSRRDIQKASRIVAMDCEIPEKDRIAKLHTQWSDIPMDQGYNDARDEIIKKLEVLILELEKQDREN